MGEVTFWLNQQRAVQETVQSSASAKERRERVQRPWGWTELEVSVTVRRQMQPGHGKKWAEAPDGWESEL